MTFPLIAPESSLSPTAAVSSLPPTGNKASSGYRFWPALRSELRAFGRQNSCGLFGCLCSFRPMFEDRTTQSSCQTFSWPVFFPAEARSGVRFRPATTYRLVVFCFVLWLRVLSCMLHVWSRVVDQRYYLSLRLAATCSSLPLFTSQPFALSLERRTSSF